MSLTVTLSAIMGDIFASLSLPPELGIVVTSNRPDLAQFQCNGAMAAAKAAKSNPRALADQIVERLKARPELAKVEIAGPGFINLDVTDDLLQAHLRTIVQDEKLGVTDSGQGQTVVLDYGGPNVAKPMHVGHLRASIIGDSLRRIFAFAGYRTLGDVHLGDWGTQMGMIIGEYVAQGQTERVLATDLGDEAAVDALLTELAEAYPRIADRCKQDEARKSQALADTVRIQNREGDYYKLWQVVRKASEIGMKRNFDALNVHFDLWKGEADVHDLIPAMTDRLKADYHAVMDDGALVFPVKRNDDDKEVPPLILYKRDGAVMYGTTDLATILERVDLYHPARIVYVVDQRQHLHFAQVFRAAKLSGIAPEDMDLVHAGFGTMNGPDGKPFKTRDGGAMKLEDLIQMGVEKARARLQEAKLAGDMDAGEKDAVAEMVAIAAIKFADLQNQRLQDYVFDIDRMISFEGKTGPYLLYQAVRIKSLLKKAADQGFAPGLILVQDTDRALALTLTEMPDLFETALRHYAPHHLCDYAYRLSQSFASFYAACHILSEPDAAVRASRLGLCDLTVRTLETVLGLLGMKVPERM